LNTGVRGRCGAELARHAGGGDYAQLTALRAPATLLIYNSIDSCCYRANVVKQGVYDDIKPYFALLASRELSVVRDLIPATTTTRSTAASGRTSFRRGVRLHVSDKEDADTDTEVLSEEELAAGLPKDNLTIVALARQMAQAIHHEAPAQADAAWSRDSGRNCASGASKR